MVPQHDDFSVIFEKSHIVAERGGPAKGSECCRCDHHRYSASDGALFHDDIWDGFSLRFCRR
jgi:hypothetical protein